nr:PREDICTED: olfactory receptor 10G9-like [Latimeria chalumnae]|eukprot:XP_014348049.1 PREDICTED: olfactory receptor 10G9-like [Latimeria chalumnae]
MTNLSSWPSISVEISVASFQERATWLKVTLLSTVSAFFLYIDILMIVIFFKEPLYRDKPRYILFIHMLINDTIQTIVLVILSLFGLFGKDLLISVCSFIVHIAGSTSLNTPFNLAIMALDRYAAIYYPLRYVEICTTKRVGIALVLIWFVGSLSSGSDLIITLAIEPITYFQTVSFCNRDVIIRLPYQSLKRAVIHGLYFSTVGLVILYTYIKIMLEARKATTDKTASKAQKTVLLHVVQLLLSMTFFLYPLTEYLIVGANKITVGHVRFVTYFLTMVLPKFLSPLIYGLRNEKFKKHLQHYFFCRLGRVEPVAVLRPHEIN